MGGTNGSVKYDSIERIHYSNLVTRFFYCIFHFWHGKNVSKYFTLVFMIRVGEKASRMTTLWYNYIIQSLVCL